ncbi:hypothetical protein QJS10_CPB21g00728 [Acorus calamus]|uniref:Uncharacterized protein n=1 Tax=Acorus calamus TaxID=4465 RepID=A0AAV9C3Z3_ACOCL|nr:hypothetical protein QJS10_CPB21g00728 [Acorus calamus]
MRAVAGAFKALGTVLSSVGKYIPGRDRWKNIGRFGPDKVSNLPRPDHHDSPKIVFLKETQSPSQSKDEHQGGASNAENARQGWYSLSCGLVASAGQYLYSLGINSARSMVSTWRTMYKSGQVIFWRVINAVRADMTNPKGWVRSGLRVTDAVAPELLGRRYGAYRLTKKVVNAALKELKDREWMVKENDQDIQIKSTNTSINSSQNHGSMGEERQGSADREGLQAPENCSGDAAGGTKEQTSSADLANDNGLVGRNVKENDKDIRIESTNTSINSGQNHGSMGEERQGSADGEVLQAPEHCSGDAAGATKEQTSSDLGK